MSPLADSFGNEGAPHAFEPFSHQFLCPHCHHADIGVYCSYCSKPLRLQDSEVEPMLLRRIELLGYKKITQDTTPHIGKLRNVLSYIRLNGLFSTGATILFLNSLEKYGQAIELLVLLNQEQFDNDQISTAIGQFIEDNRELLTNQAAEVKAGEDHIQRIAIRFTVLAKHTEKRQARPDLPSGYTKFKTKFGKGLLKNFKVFSVPLNWDTTLVELEDKSILENHKNRFDAVKSQIETSLKQCDEWRESDERAEHVASRVLTAVFGSFYDYFQILLQFISNRCVFADLIVNKHYIRAEKVIVLYLVGLVVSVIIPWALTGGHLSEKNLTIFEALPPFVNDLTELSFDVGLIFLEAVGLHLGLLILRCRGSFKTLFISLLFINAFFQIFDRPFSYFLTGPLLELVDADGYWRLVNQLSTARWTLYGFFLFPFVYVGYKTGPGKTAIAYTGASVLLLGISSLMVGDFIFSPSVINEQKLNVLLENEQTAVHEHYSKLKPFLARGDETGDYGEAVAVLGDFLNSLDEYASKAEKLTQEMQGSELEKQANGLQIFFAARREYFADLKRMLIGEISKEELERSKNKFDWALATITESFQENLGTIRREQSR